MDLQTRIGLVQCYYECGRIYTAGLRIFRTRMGLRAGPCQMKAYRNLIQKFERTGSVIDLPRSGRPRISDVQVAEVLHENQDTARGNPLAIRNANAISKRLQMSFTTVWKMLRNVVYNLEERLLILQDQNGGHIEHLRYTSKMSLNKELSAEPRSHMNAYAFFVQICRTELEKQHPNEKVVYTDFMKRCEEQWKSMMLQEKSKFYEMANKDKLQYETEKETCTTSEVNEQLNQKIAQSEVQNFPKRCLPAFYWFCDEERNKIKQEHPEYGVPDVVMALGKRWTAADSDVKSKYEAMAHKDKSRYKKEMLAYKTKNPLMFT